MMGLASNLTTMTVDVVIKATILLTVIALAAAVLRKSSAALRHLVWALGLGGALLLPLLTQMLPPLRWSVPQINRSPAPVQRPSLENARGGGRMPPVDVPSLKMKTGPGRATSTPARLFWVRAWSVAASVWGLGAMLALWRLLSGMMAVRHIAGASTPIENEALAVLVENTNRAMARGQRVVVQMASRLGGSQVPMSWGLMHHIVILPAEAEEWPQERTRAVLLHELAHVQRHDWVVQMLAQFCCVLYWFHPLAWIAARQVRRESEHACDDLVLDAGVGPADYADYLLAVARSVRTQRRTPSAAMAMVQASTLSRRVEAVLDPRAHRGSRTPRSVTAALALMGIGVCTLAALGPAGAIGPNETPTTELRGIVIAVDAGHGGQDSGSVDGGVTEKSLNLAIAFRLRSALEQHGATVTMIRGDDNYVSVADRPKMAAAHHADYLVSIHCDNLPASQYGPAGALVYFHNHADKPQRLAMSVSVGMGQTTGEPGRVVSDLTVFKTGYGVLRGAAMPAVLVECGDMAYPEDFARLRDPEGQEKIADGITAGLIAFSHQPHSRSKDPALPSEQQRLRLISGVAREEQANIVAAGGARPAGGAV